MKNKGLGWLTGVLLLLYMTMLVVPALLFFAHPPAVDGYGGMVIVAIFSIVLAIVGILAGSGLPYLGQALIALLLACLLPSWYWLKAICSDHLAVATLVYLLPVWAIPIVRQTRRWRMHDSVANRRAS
ncbi:MAG: hypothetical protein ACYCUX_04980 [Metallibacterium sp.]